MFKIEICRSHDMLSTPKNWEFYSEFTTMEEAQRRVEDFSQAFRVSNGIRIVAPSGEIFTGMQEIFA